MPREIIGFKVSVVDRRMLQEGGGDGLSSEE